jgi:hypothetical protein
MYVVGTAKLGLILGVDRRDENQAARREGVSSDSVFGCLLHSSLVGKWKWDESANFVVCSEINLESAVVRPSSSVFQVASDS